jgi:lysophospholipase L1-like esterase
MKKHLCLLISCLLALCIFTGCEDDDTTASTPAEPQDVGSNDPDLFVAIGDSITRGYGISASQSYPAQLSAMLGKTVINEGRDGERSDSGKSRISGVLMNHKPGYVLILYGANDIIHSYSSSDTLKNLRSMVQTAKSNKTIPIIATLTPAFGSFAYMEGGINRLNPLIRQMAAEEGVSVADLGTAFGWHRPELLPDGIHPNSAGQKLIATTFYDVISP